MLKMLFLCKIIAPKETGWCNRVPRDLEDSCIDTFLPATKYTPLGWLHKPSQKLCPAGKLGSMHIFTAAMSSKPILYAISHQCTIMVNSGI